MTDTKRKLICQECGGMGGHTDVILDDGSGPWEPCGFCDGQGEMTPESRGIWLTWKRQQKAHMLLFAAPVAPKGEEP